ncbi:VOC family protein [Propioniferax innocua]|uniref:VOC family protein n=1 Tax=Propioniferax innocua TaxID=1753 RepID=UPI001153ACE6|nr:VOC family protein [Propioniferax innocua]
MVITLFKRHNDALLDGGSEMACGWVTDRFGVAWQVSPLELLTLVNDPDPDRALAVNRAMQQQRSIDMDPIRDAVAACG